MKNRTTLRKISRVAAAALGTVTLATLAAAPAQAVTTWVLTGPVREVDADYGGDASAALRAAQNDLPGLEQQCIRQDGVVERSVVRMTKLITYWARVECRSKRDVS